MPKDVTFYLGPGNARITSRRLTIWNITSPSVQDLYTDRVVAGTVEELLIPLPDDHVFRVEVRQTVGGRTQLINTVRIDSTENIYEIDWTEFGFIPGIPLIVDEWDESSQSSQSSESSDRSLSSQSTITLSYSTSSQTESTTSSITSSTSSVSSSSMSISQSSLSSSSASFESFSGDISDFSDLSSSSFRFWV